VNAGRKEVERQAYFKDGAKTTVLNAIGNNSRSKRRVQILGVYQL
jgi:hypothetical protein